MIRRAAIIAIVEDSVDEDIDTLLHIVNTVNL
jgi:hypothetical protein